MKTKDLINELRSLTYQQLSQRLKEVSRALLNFRIRKRLQQANATQYKTLRRERARILTIMTQKKREHLASLK